MAAVACGEKMSMLSLFAHESMMASFCETEGAAYGAECDVVTITNSPACLHAANARSNAGTRSASPLVSSMSKHTPWKPASLMASIPTWLGMELGLGYGLELGLGLGLRLG